MNFDMFLFGIFMTLCGLSLIGLGSYLYFAAKEDYVDRLIKKRKGNEYGDW